MVTKKRQPKETGKTAAEETSRKKSAPERSAPQSDDRESVFVRISRKAKDILDSAAKPPRTRATVIEALLEYFDNEKNEAIREMILDKQIFNPLEEHGELLQLRSWAEHAFENGRYVWAGEMYKTLARHRSSSEGLKNVCKYRLSLCLIRLSYDVREEAMKESIDKKIYGVALRALDGAIKYTTEVEAKLENAHLFPKLVLYYNLASCHSLKAQYMVESELDPSSNLVDKLRNAGKKPEAKEEVWSSIGEIWRINQRERKIDKEIDVNAEARKALDELQRIFPLSTQEKTQTNPNWEVDDWSSERIWMVDSAKKDEDFIFLRSDQKWQSEFERWTLAALEGRKPNAQAVRALLDEVTTPENALVKH